MQQGETVSSVVNMHWLLLATVRVPQRLTANVLYILSLNPKVEDAEKY